MIYVMNEVESNLVLHEMCEMQENFYGIVKKVKNGEIKAYYEDVYVVKRGEEILCLVGYPPEDEILPKNEDGDDVLFVIEKGRWYMV